MNTHFFISNSIFLFETGVDNGVCGKRLKVASNIT